MNYAPPVNNLVIGYRRSKLLLGLLFCSSTISANNTLVQLSVNQFEGAYLKDGYIIGRGRVICTGEHSEFRVWMETEYVAPSQHSYVLYKADNQQVKVNIRLQGHEWQQSTPLHLGIGKAGHGGDIFDIVAHGDQLVRPGVYPLRLNAACL